MHGRGDAIFFRAITVVSTKNSSLPVRAMPTFRYRHRHSYSPSSRDKMGNKRPGRPQIGRTHFYVSMPTAARAALMPAPQQHRLLARSISAWPLVSGRKPRRVIADSVLPMQSERALLPLMPPPPLRPLSSFCLHRLQRAHRRAALRKTEDYASATSQASPARLASLDRRPI